MAVVCDEQQAVISIYAPTHFSSGLPHVCSLLPDYLPIYVDFNRYNLNNCHFYRDECNKNVMQ